MGYVAFSCAAADANAASTSPESTTTASLDGWRRM
jgi:hypothetical protein